MKIIDANVILRYLLNDIEELAVKADEILGQGQEQVFIPNEVIAEVVYVLEKVYRVKHDAIYQVMDSLLGCDSVVVLDYVVLIKALKTYATIKIDFVDAVLYAYRVTRGYSVITFDKKLAKLIESIE